MMNGIYCVDKPAGMTSFEVVSRLRRFTGERRLGHAGTLDPMATGVLPVFVGPATKEIGLLPFQDKKYEAALLLGVTTDTGDITGEVLTRREVTVTDGQVGAAAAAFSGRQKQVPPMYSALKVGGRRLYDIARDGGTVERAPREIEIYSIRVTGKGERPGEYLMEVHCSKGTYIRTLCEDIGAALGCGATMSALRRTYAAGFSISGAHTLDSLGALAAAGRLETCLLAPDYPFRALKRVTVTDRQAARFLNGGPLALDRLEGAPDDGMCVVCDENGPVGLGEVTRRPGDEGVNPGEVVSKCLFRSREKR